jgi:multidrug efflux pump subunit AcrB
MAISITFGLALATVWILDLVPTLYLVYGRLSGRGQG